MPLQDVSVTSLEKLPNSSAIFLAKLRDSAEAAGRGSDSSNKEERML